MSVGFKRIGALWLKNRKDNHDPFMAGVVDAGILGTCKVAVFSNIFKESDSQPDYLINLFVDNEAEKDVPF